MGEIKDQFASVYRDFSVDGVSASGLHEPQKSELRALGPMIEQAIGTMGLGSMVDVAYATRAALDADLAHDAGAVGLVYADATDANNDLYVKTGASGAGAWTLTSAIHDILAGLTAGYASDADVAARLAKAANLSDLEDAEAALANIGAVSQVVHDALVASLGTAAGYAATAFATALQGAKADTAVQPGANVSVLAETPTAKIMTGDERTKLAGIAAGAEVNTVTSVATKTGAVTLDKADVGLGNVDNTSDANKPVSTAQQTALNAKASNAALRGEAKAAAAASGRARTSLAGFVDYTVDRNGRLVEALDFDAFRHVVGLRLINAIGRTSTRYLGPITDNLGRLVSYWHPDGRFAGMGGFHDGEIVGGYRASARYVWGVKGSDSRVPIGLRPSGETDLIPSEDTAAALYVDPADFSTIWPVSNVRRLGNGALIATRQEADGIVSDIRKLRGKPAAITNGSSLRPIMLRLYYGQSNATNTGVEVAQLTDALYPHHALAFEGLVEGYRNTATSPSAFVGLIGIYDPEGEPQWPDTMVAFATEEKRRVAGTPSDGILYYTSHYGGQPLSTFVEGGIPYANLMLGAEKSVEVAALYGRTADCKSVVYIQGEHGTAPGDFTGFKAAVMDLAVSVTDGVQAAMGLTAPPMFILVQTNEYDNASSADLVFQDQLNASRESARIVCAGPMYQCPFEDADPIHADGLGRMVLGDLLSVVQDIVEAGDDFVPLQPDDENATLVGATITIPMLIPIGGVGLAFDTDWVLTVPDKGFVVKDDGTPVAINSVSIVGTDIVIVLASAPSGEVTVEYAVLNDATTLNGWANGRGLLYSPTAIDSTYFKLGFAVPDKVRHYCARFPLSL